MFFIRNDAGFECYIESPEVRHVAASLRDAHSVGSEVLPVSERLAYVAETLRQAVNRNRAELSSNAVVVRDAFGKKRRDAKKAGKGLIQSLRLCASPPLR